MSNEASKSEHHLEHENSANPHPIAENQIPEVPAANSSKEEQKKYRNSRRRFLIGASASIAAGATALKSNRVLAQHPPLSEDDNNVPLKYKVVSTKEYEFGRVHRLIWERTIAMPGVTHPRMKPLSPDELAKSAGQMTGAGVWGQYAGWFAKNIPEDHFIVHGSAAETLWAKMKNVGYLTPNDMFYVENHFPTPVINPEQYRLAIDGDGVDHPIEIAYAELRRMPSVKLVRSIVCGENGIGHFIHHFRQETPGMPFGQGAIGVAEWKGVRMRDVLNRAGLSKDAFVVLSVGLDTPRDRMQIVGKPLPIEKALEDDTLLVYEMNGEPLPPDHGFPVRTLVSGWVGPASVKWVGRLEVWKQPLAALFTTQYGVLIGEHYPPTPPSPEGFIMTEAVLSSAFELPWPARLPAGRHLITGRSWSPRTTIDKVEFSSDGGKTYREARLIPPNLPKAWCRWEIDWQAEPGTYGIRVRATDSEGHRQPDRIPYNFHGYLNNAVLAHPVTVT